MLERLQKLIAQAGIASRRQAEELIISGRVTINGERAALGAKADPENDHIKVNGKLINSRIGKQEKTYILLNKPKGYLTSLSDPENRKLVMELIPKKLGKLHPVGRLDFQSEGLLILTNDGEFTQKVAGSKSVPKVYEVKVKGIPTEVAINKLRRGTLLEDGFKAAPCEIKALKPTASNAWYEVTLLEGHNQQIRKMFDSVGHSVVKLRRLAIGNIREDSLPIGAYRLLREDEVRNISKAQKPKPRKAEQKAGDAPPKLKAHSRALKPKKNNRSAKGKPKN